LEQPRSLVGRERSHGESVMAVCYSELATQEKNRWRMKQQERPARRR
jgi:hypothetical protein